MEEREIAGILREAAELHGRMARDTGEIGQCIQIILDSLRSGGTLYVMGNGGSAADAQHLAGELVGRFEIERKALPCVALSTDTSILTAVANDYGEEDVFRRQVEALVRAGDVVLGISTSGNSPNVNQALQLARERGASVIGLSGQEGGQMASSCDAIVKVPHDQTPRIQEVHGTIVHVICTIVERELCS
jgi:D-sedoheptulose 7-phosphate isomerase